MHEYKRSLEFLVRLKKRDSILTEEAKLLLADYDWVNEQYNMIFRSLSSIAQELNTTTYIVGKYIKLFGFSIRPSSEQCKTSYTRKQMSDNHADVSGEKNPIYGKPRSEETKRKISEANSNPSAETRRKMSLSRKKFVGENHPNFGKHWTLGAEAREHMSISRKGKCTGPDNPMYGKTGEQNPFFGKHHTEETKQILSDKLSNPSEETINKHKEAIKIMHSNGIMIGKNHPLYGRPAGPKAGFGKGGYFTKSDGTIIWLRSTYETLFATALEQKGIVWEYEKCINLQDDIWHPDFYLPEYDLFIEVKGWLTDIAKRKMTKFNNEYPNIRLLVLGKKDIELFLDTNISIEEVGMILDDYLKIHNLIEENSC